jgi:hypothetical protein
VNGFHDLVMLEAGYEIVRVHEVTNFLRLRRRRSFRHRLRNHRLR